MMMPTNIPYNIFWDVLGHSVVLQVLTSVSYSVKGTGEQTVEELRAWSSPHQYSQAGPEGRRGE